MITPTTMSEAKRELHGLFSEACYEAIRNSGLHKLLENRAWDDLADEFGMKAMEFVEGLCERQLQERCEAAMREYAGMDELIGVGK